MAERRARRRQTSRRAGWRSQSPSAGSAGSGAGSGEVRARWDELRVRSRSKTSGSAVARSKSCETFRDPLGASWICIEAPRSARGLPGAGACCRRGEGLPPHAGRFTLDPQEVDLRGTTSVDREELERCFEPLEFTPGRFPAAWREWAGPTAAGARACRQILGELGTDRAQLEVSMAAFGVPVLPAWWDSIWPEVVAEVWPEVVAEADAAGGEEEEDL